MTKKPKVLMIWTQNTNETVGGVGQYRIVSPGRKLKELGYDVEIIPGSSIAEKFGETIEEAYPKMMQSYDLIWMKHTDNMQSIGALFALRQQYPCKIVWDFDDDLFNVRPSQKIAYEQYGPGQEKRDIVATAISFCDALTVSTEHLKKQLGGMIKEMFDVNIPIFVCPNFLNIEEWNYIKYRPSNSPVIGYYGSTTHADDLELVKPAIYKILKKYPTVNFNVIGMATSKEILETFADCPDVELLKRVHLAGGTKGWAGFPDLVLRQNWDIAIAPLIDDKFNRSKSHIKWMECAMKSIPVVASNVYPYREKIFGTKAIEDGKTGFLVNDKDWVKTLSKLIENPDLRVKVGEVARETVIKDWNADKQIKHWAKALDGILAL
jgi:glycosyltransferase involved in cell wall biosynthesis